jgi:hypothetical protein
MSSKPKSPSQELNQVLRFFLFLFFSRLFNLPMEGEERHDVGSAPARSSTLLTLTAESPTAAKTALAAARSFDKTIPTTTTATPTPLLSAAASVPSMSPLPGPSKEGSQRAGNLLHSIAQGTLLSNMAVSPAES